MDIHEIGELIILVGVVICMILCVRAYIKGMP